MRVALVIVFACALGACAAGVSTDAGTANSAGIVAGFWRGAWHGFIAPVTFIVSLFTHDVGIYEAHNNGGWYDAGFLIGINAALGGHAARRGLRRR